MTELKLPEVKAPSLEKLEVRVPKPEDISEAEVATRLHELVREHAKKKDRVPGEKIQRGDDVQVDILGYANGKLIPFSARFDQWLEVGPIPELPGLTEAIEGASVGDSVEVDVQLHDDYPAPAFAGKRASFLLDVKAAREVKTVGAEDPKFLKAVNRGKTVEELLASIIEELEDSVADELWVVAQNLVLDELVKRADPSVPDQLVDEEIRRRWEAAEGRFLVNKKFDDAELREALSLWMNDEAVRADAWRRVAIAMTLKAIAQRDRIAPNAEELKELISVAAKSAGLEPEDMRRVLATNGDALETTGWHLAAVAHVMKHAKVTFG